MAEEAYEVKIDAVFEGPLDLLLHLIKKNEVDIYDIPIALVTDQYLEYIEWMKSMNIDLAGDFIVMASTLTQIKSKMLLPVHQGIDDEEDDPRLELTGPLVEYIEMKTVAEELAKRPTLDEDVFTRESQPDDFPSDTGDELIHVGIFELIDAFRKILENIPAEHYIDLTDEKISIKDKILELVDILEKEVSITFETLFAGVADKQNLILTFLAVLEMAKLQMIRIYQHVENGVIRVVYVAGSKESIIE